MSNQWDKDPNAVLDFKVDWTDWLAAGETIVTSVWTVSGGLVEDSSEHDGKVATIWLSGGDESQTRTRFSNRITTNSSPARTDERSLFVRIVDR